MKSQIEEKTDPQLHFPTNYIKRKFQIEKENKNKKGVETLQNIVLVLY